MSLLAHHLDLVAGLHLRFALVIQYLRERQHAFRLGADVYNDVSRRQLQHRAFDHTVFSHGLFGLRGEVLQRRGKVLIGGLIVGSSRRVRRFLGGSCGCGRSCSLIRFRQMLLSRSELCGRRFCFGYDGGGGIGVVGGGIVEQSHASLLEPRTRCGEDAGPAWRTAGVSRLVVVGSPWRVSLDNPSCRTFYRNPRPKGTPRL